MNEPLRHTIMAIHKLRSSHGLLAKEHAILERIEFAMIRGDDAGDISCRYSESGDHWNVTYMDGGRRLPISGFLGTQPEWLQRILDVAKIGDHEYRIPPRRGFNDSTCVVWFRIDTDNNLTEFIDWR